jgi:type I restriction enzyme S subunit
MTMPEQKKAVAPRLRFPEFRDAGPWEVKRLGDIGPVCMCKRVLKHQTSAKGDIPFYKIGTFGSKPDAYISKELYESYKSIYPFPNKGDVLISASGTIGRTVVYDGLPAYFQDSNIVWIANKEAIVLNAFLTYCYETVRWTTDDNTIPRLYNDNLRKMKIVVPSKQEQQKIADCLSSLDELIELEAKKLQSLQAHKKGLMQQLFPREGETTPRLRFPEFHDAGPWEVKRLGDVAEIYQPETIPLSSLSNNGEFLVYGANGIIGRFDCYNHEQPQIAVTCRGSTCGEVTLTRPRSWITGNSMVVNVDNSPGVIKGFLYFQLKGTNWNYLITGSGQPQITGEIKKHKVALPSLDEQQKIADCLSSLDELIELEAKKLEALQAHKKGLMQQLFPQEIDQ